MFNFAKHLADKEFRETGNDMSNLALLFKISNVANIFICIHIVTLVGQLYPNLQAAKNQYSQV